MKNFFHNLYIQLFQSWKRVVVIHPWLALAPGVIHIWLFQSLLYPIL
jgi:hypothetical protein